VRLEAVACAKINLTLRVLGVRPDGYHELRTVFQSVALCDRLTFERVPGSLHITATDPRCPTDRTNLVWRAAEAIWTAAGRRGHPTGVRVVIDKGIPLEAGLGGGSSDGAAALRAFARLWHPGLDRGRLEALAAGLGADVPYFLTGGTALGVERGDRLFALMDRPRRWVVIAQPDVGVSTREAFGWLDEDRSAAAGRSGGARAASGGPYGDGGNDLQPAVERRHPVVKQLVAALVGAGAEWAAMSGSGSAVFGLFAGRARAAGAAATLRDRRCETFLTRTLSAGEYGHLSAPVLRHGRSAAGPGR
jgi:4-diphosphocytidyl-2-C-methyl-D-erythritol kinase